MAGEEQAALRMTFSRLSKDDQAWVKSRETAEAAQMAEPESFTLIVVIKTGGRKYDGTDSPVYILLNGDESLKHQLPETFPAGSERTFSFDFDHPVSEVESITVQIGGSNAWRVKDIAFQIVQDDRRTEIVSVGGGYFSTGRAEKLRLTLTS